MVGQSIIMIGSQKRRNYSRELLGQSRHFHSRQGVSLLLNSYQTLGMFKERAINRSLGIGESDQSLLRRKAPFTPTKNNQHFSTLDTRLLQFGAKMRNILKTQEPEESKQNKENSANYQTGGFSQLQKVKSAIFKRSQVNLREFLEPGGPHLPYFIQCLKRKSVVSTEACMHIHNSIHTFKQYLRAAQGLKNKAIDLRIPAQRESRKTVVLDMDETLIHTSDIMTKGYELKVPFKSVQGRVVSGYVNVRPYAKELIRNLSRYFDVIFFTAGNQCYADPILDHLDPDRVAQHRLYRDSCTVMNNHLFLKDLRILGRRLQGVVLVDNSPHSYMMQLSNGVPILNYMRGKQDDQLPKLQQYLMGLLEIDDVRTANHQTFRLNDYHRYDHYEPLVQELYAKWL